MQVATIGLDLAKHVFQVHGVDAEGGVVVRKRLKRSEVTAFFAGLKPCLVGMEACSTSHYWAREIGRFGHVVPHWSDALSDPYSDLSLGAYSWTVMLAEIVTGFVLGVVGFRTVRREESAPRAQSV